MCIKSVRTQVLLDQEVIFMFSLNPFNKKAHIIEHFRISSLYAKTWQSKVVLYENSLAHYHFLWNLNSDVEMSFALLAQSKFVFESMSYIYNLMNNQTGSKNQI